MIQLVVFNGTNELEVCACMIHLVFCGGMIYLKVLHTVISNYIHSLPNCMLSQNGNVV
jgi:hypothetical protein